MDTPTPNLAGPLQNPGALSDGEITLIVSAMTPGNPEQGWAPAYHFKVYRNGNTREAGQVALRVGWSKNLLLYGGHIGYTIEPEFRGRHYAEKAVRLMLPLAWKHGLPEVWITCNPDNYASIRTIERLGFTFKENVPLPSNTDMAKRGELSKNRYFLRRPGSTL